MKKIFSLLLIAAISTGVKAQTTQVKQGQDVLTLKETQFEFGKIQQGQPVTHDFFIANNSADSLKLERVQASCGCTTPVWKNDPVAPGGSTQITVGFNAQNEGPFEKLVTIYYNGGQVKTLTIKGTVAKMPSTPAPPNASVNLLKQINQ
ncbi:MAG: DUF1573 domain-containing protein [Williamsia sp.]|nr:DUF1573 domain-containing protein [Williamsia sp.]